MRYFLIGFMGSGKSSIGKQLAKELNIKHIGLDNFIEESEKIKIVDIFNNLGEKYFRKLEEKYLKEIIKEDNILVSTGGGTPTNHGLMDIMISIGETIYLDCCTETLFESLNKDKEKTKVAKRRKIKSNRQYSGKTRKQQRFMLMTRRQ